MKTCDKCGSILSEPEVHSCVACGNTCPDKGLVARILYKSGAYNDIRLCSWTCVMNWLCGVTTDHAIVLPTLRFVDIGVFLRAMRSTGDRVGDESGVHAI